MVTQWHSISADEALQLLHSKHSGLTEDQAKAQLLQCGPNELRSRKKTPPFIVFLRQFLSPLIYVLLVAAIISIIVEHIVDAGVIFGVLLLNAAVSFMQETRAERAM